MSPVVLLEQLRKVLPRWQTMQNQQRNQDVRRGCCGMRGACAFPQPLLAPLVAAWSETPQPLARQEQQTQGHSPATSPVVIYFVQHPAFLPASSQTLESLGSFL